MRSQNQYAIAFSDYEKLRQKFRQNHLPVNDEKAREKLHLEMELK
jgi:hypothetical protein